MFARFILAVLLADLLVIASVTIEAVVQTRDVPLALWFGRGAAMVATPVLFAAMGTATVALARMDHAAGLDRWWYALGVGALVGMLLFGMLNDFDAPLYGAWYGAAAGFSLWLCLRHSFRAARAGL